MRLLTHVALIGGALLLLAGCSDDAPPSRTEDPGAPAMEDPGLEHVHGLGIDPADDQLYAAAHFGVFRISDDGSFTRVADRWQDTMAFTVAGPHRFLASGHPDLRERDLPPHLGLMESTDGAETWTSVSLSGDADFHALDVSGSRVFGYDSVGQRLLVTSDRRTWGLVSEGPLLDIAADPGDADRVLAITGAGDLVAHQVAGGETVVARAPALVMIDWPEPDLLVGVTGSGAVYRSRDAGRSWEQTAAPPGRPQAHDVTSGRWYVATDAGIFVSRDDGETWDLVVRTAG
jgi:hypothetical protein